MNKAIATALLLLVFTSACTNENVETSPIKVSVGEKLFQYGTVRTPYRTVDITSIADGLTINSVMVNRNQCRASVGNPSKSFNLSFGKTITYNYNVKCDIVEIVIDTNKGSWTFNP